MYKEYLEFIANPEKREIAIEILKTGWPPQKEEPSEKDIQKRLFQGFVQENCGEWIDDYELENCILLDFPLSFLAEILEEFVSNPYAYAWGADLQIAKLIYHLWPKYMHQGCISSAGSSSSSLWKNYNRTYPHDKIFNSLYTLRDHLLEFNHLHTREQIEQRCRQTKLGSRYYNWHVFAFYPLLETEGIEILMNVIKLDYDDAQDMLMFGLAQYDPSSFLPYFAKILEHWHIYENISFCGGTGMRGELEEIIKHYNKKGVNVYQNQTIREILENYDLYEEQILDNVNTVNTV